MKKIIFMMIAMISMAISANAQNQSNYSGSSKFTDNWSVTLQAGAVTPFDNFAKKGSTTPVIVLNADKAVNPWLTFGLDARTSIGVGSEYNPHTAFDAVNLSVGTKINLMNLIAFNGTRKTFEVSPLAQLGWSHWNCSDFPTLSQNYDAGVNGVPSEMLGNSLRNSVTFRTGVEFAFNLGKKKAWSVVATPTVVWCNIDNMRLAKNTGNFELTAGVRYYFKTSNGTHHYAKARLYDADEVARLTAEIEALKNAAPKVVEVVKEVPVTNAVEVAQTLWTVMFSHDSAELTDAAKTILDTIGQNAVVDVNGYASKEPKSDAEYNTALSTKRAQAVADYLTARGVKVAKVTGCGMNDEFGRVAVVTAAK